MQAKYTMRGFPSSSGCVASPSVDPPTYPHPQPSVDGAGYGTAEVFNGRNNEEVGFFDVVLPRPASSEGAGNPKGRNARLRNTYSAATPTRSSFSSYTSAEATESRFSVRMAGAGIGETGEKATDHRNQADSKCGEKGKNDAYRDVVEQAAYMEENKKCSSENRSTCNASAEVSTTVQGKAALQPEISRSTNQRVIADVRYIALPPLSDSTVHNAGFQTELPQDAIYADGSVNDFKLGEEGNAPAVTSVIERHSTASVTADEGSTPGVRREEFMSEHGTVGTSGKIEISHASSHPAAAVEQGNSDPEGQDGETMKSPQFASGHDGVPGGRQTEPCVTAYPTHAPGVDGCAGELGGAIVLGVAKSANTLRAKQAPTVEMPLIKMWETKEEVGEPRRGESEGGVETDARSGSTYQTSRDAGSGDALAVDSKTVRSERRSRLDQIGKAQAFPTHCEVRAGGSESTPSIYKNTSTSGLCANLLQSTRGPTSSYLDKCGRALVTSRRQLFERGAATTSGQMPSRLILSKYRHCSSEDGEVKDTSAAAVGRGNRTAGEISRKGSVVEMLREKYERSTTESSVGSASTQRLANTRALLEPFACAKKGNSEPAWRRKQREKLQAMQKATGQTCTAVSDTHGSKKEQSMSSAALDGTLKKGNFKRKVERDDVAEASTGTVPLERDGCRTAAETGDAIEIRRSCKQQPQTAITVYSGECSTVTSLKEKFERQTMASIQAMKQRQQPQPTVPQLQRSAERVKLVREQYNRRTSSERSRSIFPDHATALPPIMMKTPTQTLLNQKGVLCESSTRQQHTGRDLEGTAARSPVKCLREEYQRLLEVAAAASPRAATSVPVVSSTSVKSARELLASIDIAGRYGKEYRIAKAEKALKKEHSQSAGEASPAPGADERTGGSAAVRPARTIVADERAHCCHKSLRDSRSTEALPQGQSGENANAGRQSGCLLAKTERHKSSDSEFFASERGSISGVELGAARGNDTSAKQEEEAPVNRLVTQPRSKVADHVAPNCRQGVEVPGAVTTDLAEVALQVGRGLQGGAKRPALSARASSKIGALASALGPAFSNFGKAPPPRLLTRAEPTEETEEIDLEIFGFSKAQEAIERRKRELKLSATRTDSITAEAVASCAEKTTGKAHSSDEAPKVCNLRSTGDQKHDSSAGVSVTIITGMSDQKAQLGEVNNDEKLSRSSVTHQYLRNSMARDDVDELSCTTAGTKLSSTGERVASHSSHTKRVLHLHGKEDNVINTSCGQELTTCTGEGRDSCSSPTSAVGVVDDPGGMATAAVDGCSYQTSHLDRKIVNKNPGNGQALDGQNGVYLCSRSQGAASEHNYSSGSCPGIVSIPETSEEALSGCRRARVEPPSKAHVKGGRVKATPAEDVTSTPSTKNIGVSSRTAKLPPGIQKSSVHAKTTVEGKVQASGPDAKSVPANDEAKLTPRCRKAQIPSAKIVRSTEGPTPVSEDDGAKADDTNSLQEEELENESVARAQ